RRAQAVAWDSRVNRILVFGGILDVEKAANDFWGFRRGIGWTQLTEDGASTSPSRRDQAAMDWDGPGLRLLLFGGRGEQNRELNDLWEFGPSSIWQQLVAADHSSAPPARASHTASWGTEAGRPLVYGGAAGEQTLGDLWQYSKTGGWKRLHETGAPGTPDARFGHATAFDPKGKRLLVYGGCTDLECPTNEVWQCAPLRR
ncbi:MAG: hypothetical protein HY329_20410, partial [Chloroflexi bacterium]|nr:hypothetical protein [Chloroflexota bacterium]